MKRYSLAVKYPYVGAILTGAVSLLMIALVQRLPAQRSAESEIPATITVDYPPRAAIIPPEFPPVAFRWRDGAAKAAVWRVEIAFTDESPGFVVKTQGAGLKVGEIAPK